ncbi:formate dehydrogenase, mitochondrial-like [Cornus florida]|uniref:formate dehydrogenase, mitochondrial-like n=1 Tax=Cornus florida TaxID=4283 RepID=UPI002898B266|nr:formate dehydrogenase, mitochondrial-like [Cornus florida]
MSSRMVKFRICICYATHLPECTENSQMHAYTTVAVGKHRVKKTRTSSLNMRSSLWYSVLFFTLDVSEVDQEGVMVSIKLYRKDANSKNDEYIGGVYKSLNQFWNERVMNDLTWCDLPLKKDLGEFIGWIHFAYGFIEDPWWNKLSKKKISCTPIFCGLNSKFSHGSKKIIGFSYKANECASIEPNFTSCVEGALGIRDWLESQGHQYIVIDGKDGSDCELEKHIPDLHVLITTPFHPTYATAERIKKAKKLQLVLTAGIGSDLVDLKAAAAACLTVVDVTGNNVVSVADDELMRILILVKNLLPRYHQVFSRERNVTAIAHRAYHLEGKTVGIVGAGRISRLLLQRLEPFNCNLLYHDWVKMDSELENQTGAKFEEDLDSMIAHCDIIVINTPLMEKTKGMFDKDRIAKLKKGVLIVNNAWGAITDAQAVVDAYSSGQIAGYSGYVWYPHPSRHWKCMPIQAMTPHISGTTIDAQLQYAAGVKDMLKRYLKGEDFPPQNYIVKEGQLVSY